MFKLKNKEIILILILYFSLIFPVIISSETHIFDEIWYVNSAKMIIEERVSERPEHPPLGQLIISTGILIFGDNPFGWRFFNTLFGAASIVILYFLTNELLKNRTISISVAFILTFDKLFFTFSSLAVLDIFYLSFMLLSIYFCIRERYLFSALTLALSANCKLSAIFIIPVLILYIIYRNMRAREYSLIRWFQLRNIVVWIISFTIFFLSLLYLFDKIYIGSMVSDLDLTNPFSHIMYMLKTHSSEYWPQDVGSKPWFWLLQPQNYYLGRVSIVRIEYLESFNPLLLGISFITIPTIVYYLIKKKETKHLLPVIWFLITYFIWYPISFFFKRPLFSFYILIFIPAISILNISFFREDEKVIKLYLLLNLMYFMIFQYPLRAIINF